MNSLIVFAILIATVMAKPGEHVSVNQDTLGNYNLNLAVGGISRVENRDIHGNVVGGYAFIDPHGIQRSIQFTSGVHGFNAVGADIPQPVQDTPEVAHAKYAHLSVLRDAYLTAPPQPLEIVHPHLVQVAHAPLIRSLPVAHAPAFHQALLHGAVPETYEVAAARAEHLAAHAAATAGHGGHIPLF